MTHGCTDSDEKGRGRDAKDEIWEVFALQPCRCFEVGWEQISLTTYPPPDQSGIEFVGLFTEYGHHVVG